MPRFDRIGCRTVRHLDAKCSSAFVSSNTAGSVPSEGLPHVTYFCCACILRRRQLYASLEIWRWMRWKSRVQLTAGVERCLNCPTLLSDNGNSVRLVTFDRGSNAYQVEVGTEVPHLGSAVGRALDEQKPIYIPDLQAEVSKISQLASQPRLGTPHSAYVFPISTSGKKLGVLTFGLARGANIQPRRRRTHDLGFIACCGCAGERNCHRCRGDVPTAIGAGA